MIQEVLQSHLAHLYNHQVTGGLRIPWSRPSKDRSILSGLKHDCLNISFHLPPDLGDLIKSWAHLLLWPRRKQLTEVEFWWGIWGESPEATLADEWPEEPKLQDEGPVCVTSGRDCWGQALFSPKADVGRKLAALSAVSEEVAQGNSQPGSLFRASELIVTTSFFHASDWGPAENNGLQWERHRNTKGRGDWKSSVCPPPLHHLPGSGGAKPWSSESTMEACPHSVSGKMSCSVWQGSQQKLGSYLRRWISGKSYEQNKQAGLPPAPLSNLETRRALEKVGPGENNQLWTKEAERQRGKTAGVINAASGGGFLTNTVEATKEMEMKRGGEKTKEWLPFPSPGDLPDPEIELRSPAR